MRDESALERRFWTFWLVGILLLAAQIVMNVWLVTDASPLGMSDHQAAVSAGRVNIIHTGWAASGVMDLAIYSMELDLMFIVVYAWGAFAGGRMFAASSHAMLARLGKVVMFAAIGFAISDFAETISQLVQAAGAGGVDLLANIAAKMRPIKMILFLVTFFGLLVALGILRKARHVALRSSPKVSPVRHIVCQEPNMKILASIAALACASLSVPTAAMAQDAATAAVAPTASDADAFVARAEKDLFDFSVEGGRVALINATYLTDDTDAIAARYGEIGTEKAVGYALEAAKYQALPGLSYDTKRKLDILRGGIVLPAPTTPGAAAELATI